MSTDTQNSKRPSHRLYQVTGDGKAAIWTQFASAWPHKDGKGYTILVPFIGKIVMREVAEASSDDGEMPQFKY